MTPERLIGRALLFLFLVLPLILLLFVIAPQYLHAAPVAATHLLSRGPGAEAAALGSSVTPTIQDPTALYWNPAGLAFGGRAVAGEHLFLYDGARDNFLGLSVPSRLATFGLGALQLRRGNIIARARIDDPGHEVSNTQTAYMLGAARAIGEHWAVGGTAYVLDFDIAGFRARGYGMDLALQGRFSGRDIGRLQNTVWSLGGVVKNLVEPSGNALGAMCGPRGELSENLGIRRGLGRIFGSSEGATVYAAVRPAFTPGDPKGGANLDKAEKVENGSGRRAPLPEKQREIPAALGGGYCGQRGPCGLMRGGPWAERAAPRRGDVQAAVGRVG